MILGILGLTPNASASQGTNTFINLAEKYGMTQEDALQSASQLASQSALQSPMLGVDSRGDRLVSNGFTYNGHSVDVERFFTPYPLITANVGKTNIAEFKIYDNLGSENIRHFSFAFGLDKGQIISQSKAMIELDIDFDGTETVTVTDPENALENIRVDTGAISCGNDFKFECLGVTIFHTFRAPLDFNIVATDVWNTKRSAWQNYYNHGIEVVGESLNSPKEYDGIHKGLIYHLAETGKNTAVDEQGNTWTFDKTWKMDYISKGKIIDGVTQHGINRDNAWFNTYKQGQGLLANKVMEQYCTSCSDKEFAEIDNIFAYEFQETMNKLSDPEIQKKMLQESKIAENTLQQIYTNYPY